MPPSDARLAAMALGAILASDARFAQDLAKEGLVLSLACAPPR